MIEKNPALKYLPFFPVKIKEKSTKKSEFMKAQCEKHKLKDIDTFKFATILDKTEKYGSGKNFWDKINNLITSIIRKIDGI